MVAGGFTVGESSANGDFVFEPAEGGVGSEGEEGGGDSAGEDEGVVYAGDATEDQFAEAAGTDGCGDGRDANAGYGRRAQSG